VTQKAKNGFTLIELLVVLLIFGLLVSLAPPAFKRVLPGLELKSGARELAAVFRESRNRAIRDNRATAVVIDVQEKIYQVEGRSFPLPQTFEIQLFTAESERLSETTGRIRFFPDGTSTGGRVTLESDDTAYYIVADWLSGRVEIVDLPATP
jgi:general secretion pathway protein H